MSRGRFVSWVRWALLSMGASSSLAVASDVRGTLQGADTLSPSPRPSPPGLRAYYWEVPNGVLPIASPRASTEFDIGLILTGEGVAESRQPVTLRVEGGRCRPGTLVLTPGAVLRIDNQDFISHSLYAVSQGTDVRAVPEELTAAHTLRQVTFATAGVYELRDARQGSFRCWVVVGSGQGRVLNQDSNGAFVITGLTDGEYTVRAWYEGVERGSQAVRIAGRDAQVTLRLGQPGTPAQPSAPAQPAPPAIAPLGH